MKEPFALFLNGGYGVGKSTVLEHIAELLVRKGVPFCLMDVDWFHRCWPAAPEDPENVRTEATNIAQVWTNYQQSGPRQLVMAGIMSGQGDLERYELAVALPIRSVRLEASPSLVRQRLRGRYSADQRDALDWHLQRLQETASKVAAADLDAYVVLTDNLTPGEVAARVLTECGIDLSRPTTDKPLCDT